MGERSINLHENGKCLWKHSQIHDACVWSILKDGYVTISAKCYAVAYLQICLLAVCITLLSRLQKFARWYYRCDVGYCDNPHSNIKALCTETVHLVTVAILKWMAHIHNQTFTNKISWNIGKMGCNIQTTISKLQTFLVTTIQLLTWRHAAVVKLVNIRIWIMFAQSVNDNSLLM